MDGKFEDKQVEQRYHKHINYGNRAVRVKISGDGDLKGRDFASHFPVIRWDGIATCIGMVMKGAVRVTGRPNLNWPRERL